MIHVGFTGTRRGMTDAQKLVVAELLRKLEPLRGGLYLVGHHGDCVGADAQFHHLVRAMSNTIVTVHPPSDARKRAWVTCREDCDEWRPSRPYLDRNRDIVHESDAMIATPEESQPQPRSGTWSTIRYAQQVSKPLAIVFPNGAIAYDGAPWPA